MTDDSVTEVEVGIRLVMIGEFEYFSYVIDINWCLLPKLIMFKCSY